MPAPIIFENKPLPCVDAWAHIGNELSRCDMSWQRKCSLDTDVNNKRMKFIGKYYALRQEFGSLDPEIFFKIMNIYGTSFYGSNLWIFTSDSCEKLFTSWNVMIRNIWNLPNTTDKYFIEEISGSKHLKSMLLQRYLSFIKSIRNSKKTILTLRTMSCGILNRALPVLDPLLPADNNSIRNRDLGLAIHLCAT